MDAYKAIGLAEGWIEVQSDDDIIEAWQYLHETGIAYQLQGWYARRAKDLLDAGIIT